jgi:hypothetical protein
MRNMVSAISVVQLRTTTILAVGLALARFPSQNTIQPIHNWSRLNQTYGIVPPDAVLLNSFAQQRSAGTTAPPHYMPH